MKVLIDIENKKLTLVGEIGLLELLNLIENLEMVIGNGKDWIIGFTESISQENNSAKHNYIYTKDFLEKMNKKPPQDNTGIPYPREKWIITCLCTK